MGLSVWRETSKKLTVYRVCYTPIATLKQGIKYQCWCGVNFPRDLKCRIPSSLTLEIAFKRRKGFRHVAVQS